MLYADALKLASFYQEVAANVHVDQNAPTTAEVKPVKCSNLVHILYFVA